MSRPNDDANHQQFNFFEEINRDELPVRPAPPLNLETTTVWSFPERGKWATHQSDYRGNFAPQVARNIILAYSQEGDYEPRFVYSILGMMTLNSSRVVSL